MKTFNLTLVLFVILGIVNAQEESDTINTTSDPSRVKIIIQTDKDTTEIMTFGDEEEEDSKKDRDFSLRFGMIDLGVSTYIPSGGNLNDLPEEYSFMEQRLIKSTNININFVRHRLRLTQNEKLNFEYGLTFMSNKYFFEDDFRLEADKATFDEAVVMTEENFRKNRLMANYLTIPINFGFVSNPDELSKAFKLSVGAYGGFRIGANHKIKGGDISGKVKTKDDFNLNQFIWGLEGRAGFGPLNLYAQYTMTPMFRDDRGPDFNQFNVGITILPY